MPLPLVIAVDGPSGVGKNAVGFLLAKRLNYRFIDTGAMYRAITWLALERGINSLDEEALGKLAADTEIELRQPDGLIGGHNPVFVDSRDVTPYIRRPEVEANVSQVSKVAEVRRILVAKQRLIAKGGQVVMVGRDIGTTVLPDADLKLFLTASLEERAHRRHLELLESCRKVDYDTVLADLRRRDEIDSHRAISPLRPAPDAKIVDTDSFDLEQVVIKVLEIVTGC